MDNHLVCKDCVIRNGCFFRDFDNVENCDDVRFYENEYGDETKIKGQECSQAGIALEN